MLGLILFVLAVVLLVLGFLHVLGLLLAVALTLAFVVAALLVGGAFNRPL